MGLFDNTSTLQKKGGEKRRRRGERKGVREGIERGRNGEREEN